MNLNRASLTITRGFALHARLGDPETRRFEAPDVNGDLSGRMRDLDVYRGGKKVTMRVPTRSCSGPWDALETAILNALESPSVPEVNLFPDHHTPDRFFSMLYGRDWRVKAREDLGEVSERAVRERLRRVG